MASTAAGRRLTEAHRLAQARLGVETVRRMIVFWRLLDPRNLDATSERWLRVTVPLIEAQRRQSAALAGQYYTTFRIVEVGDGFTPTLRSASDLPAVTTSLMVTGPVYLRQQMEERSLARAAEFARVASARAAMRHAMAGGRDSLLDNIRDDELALGWARVTSGRPCAFCAMLASRGPVYSEQRTADFAAHDNCSCAAEPVYDRSTAWPPRSREFRDLYDQVAKGERDPLNAFRRAYESQLAA